MSDRALVVIDLQNDITKNYKEIIETVNEAIDWAQAQGITVVYIQHNNLSAKTRTFKPGTRGAELVPELKVVSEHIFTKSKSNALTSEDFAAFVQAQGLSEFFVVGADAMHPALYNLQYPNYMEDCKKHGKRVHVWTVNEEQYMRMVCEMQVDAMITNYPDVGRRIAAEYLDGTLTPELVRVIKKQGKQG